MRLERIQHGNIVLRQEGLESGKPYVYIQCNFCNEVIKEEIKRMKDHLRGTHRNVAPCLKVPKNVKNEMKDYIDKSYDP